MNINTENILGNTDANLYIVVNNLFMRIVA